MLGQTIRLGDFSPDLDPATPGVITDCDNLIGTTRGLRVLGSFDPLTVTSPTPGSLPSAARGTYSAILVNGERVVVCGTATDLYTLNEGAAPFTWTNRTRLSGPYSPSGRWSFATFGNDIFATNGVDVTQVLSLAAPEFVDLAPTPPSQPVSIVEVSAYGYVFLVETDSYTWRAAVNPFDWTPNIAVGCVQTNLDATPGPITGLHRLRDGVAAFKRRSLFMGSFVGPPFFWQFNGISDQVGLMNQDACVEADDVLYFLGPDDFWRFDGATLSRVQNNLAEWFFRRLDARYMENVLACFDRSTDLIFWHFPTGNNGGRLNEWVALNVRTGKWTKGMMDVEDVVSGGFVAESELTYQEFEDTPNAVVPIAHAAYDVIPDIPYNSTTIEQVGMSVFAVVDLTHTLGTMLGTPNSAYLETGEFGDGSTVLLAKELRPIFAVAPANPLLLTSLLAFKRMINGSVRSAGPTAVMNATQGTFYFTQTARSHQFRLELTQLAEIVGVKLDLHPVGIN
jgi:hypothetical protein